MKTKYRSAALIASAVLTLAPAAQASLLVGWHDFQGQSEVGYTSIEAPDFIASGFEARLSKSLTSRDPGGDTGGSSGLFYGDSTYASGSGGDGFIRLGSSPGTFIELTNKSGSTVPLAALLFDAATQFGGTVSTFYRYGTSGAWNAIGSAIGSLAAIPDTNGGTTADYTDISLSLVGMNLNDNQVIQFAFSGGSTVLDNIAITAIPEPAGLLALACLLGSGLMLRSRPRAIAAPATA